MGTSQKEVAPNRCASPIYKFYSSTSWIEGSAEDQLKHVAGMDGVLSIAAFPDLHPGKYGPVGCALLSTRIYPQLIGNDIGCGMSLFALDLPGHKFRLNKSAQKLRALEEPWGGDPAARLVAAGLSPELAPESLGTIGGGNHFCELQTVETIFDGDAMKAADLEKGQLLLFVHSGSRSLGTSTFATVQDQLEGLASLSDAAQSYLALHDKAIVWASLNRAIIAERAANALRCDLRLVCDIPHNLIEKHEDGWLHRKGAAKADCPLVPLAGSRDALSFLLKPAVNRPEALLSLAHGAGRKYDRASMNGRAGTNRQERDNLTRTSFGGLVICEDRQLLIEEAPQAYKDPAHVVQQLEALSLATRVAALKPLVTFKKAMTEDLRAERQEKKKRLQDRRAAR
ncbi:RNA ligase RtcB family protein [Roseibium suaedae]|uniref:3'-phosphate/5'-hydroxy nucleic acid ligase n=1 Tax=Roseibium suaedae TaxID=735517 RepID=A0A1M7GCJ8_9HYPH|nr:RNA ligase RtcB family protein [Roseibium suaedae]SHM14003.1 release factor H-coupled RctB family protein [Roseibium suaedae]